MPFNKHFNKELYEISQEDLENFFSDEVQETSTLELKSGGVDINKIYREICAFLNTEGGTLIIGAPEEVEKEVNGITQKVYSGELIPSDFKNKDWLTQKTSSYIVPAPIEIKIQEVPYGKGKIYVLQIPNSSTPPHQDTTSGKYYIRMEGEAKAAPHGIVEALFNQASSANLSLNLEVEKIKNSLFKISALISNNELKPAEDITIFISAVGKIYAEKDQYGVSSISKGDGITIINKTEKLKTSLVSGLGSSVTLDIRAFDEEIKVLAGYWCKNTDVHYDAIVYRLSDQEVVEHQSTKNNDGYELIDEISQLATPNAS